MADPNLQAELDSLFDQDAAADRELRTLALTGGRNRAAIRRASDLQTQRQQYRQRFEEISTTSGDDYKAWYQARMAPPQEEPDKPLTEQIGGGLMSLLKKGGAVAYRGAQGFSDLPLAGAQALGRAVGADEAAGNIGKLRGEIDKTAQGFEESADMGGAGKFAGTAARTLTNILTPLPLGGPAKTLMGSAGRGAAIAGGLEATQEYADKGELNPERIAGAGAVGAVAGPIAEHAVPKGLDWLMKRAGSQGLDGAKAIPRSNAEAPQMDQPIRKPFQVEDQRGRIIYADDAATRPVESRPFQLEDQRGRVIYGQPPPLALPAPEPPSGAGFLQSRILHGKGTPPPNVAGLKEEASSGRSRNILASTLNPRPKTPVDEAIADLNTSVPPRYPQTADEAIEALQPRAKGSGPSKKVLPVAGVEPAAAGVAKEAPGPATASRLKAPRPIAGGAPTLDAAVESDLTDTVLNKALHGQIIGLAKDLFSTGKIQHDPSKRIGRQIVDAVVDGKLGGQDFEALLGKHGLTRATFAEELLAPLHTEAGRTLQRLSWIQRQFGAKAPEVERLGVALKQMGLDVDDSLAFNSWWKRIDNVRRGALVTQLSTAMRNFETQVGRVGLDVLEAPLDAGIQKLTGRPATTSPLDGLEALSTIFKGQTKAQAEKVLNAFPGQKERLFATYSSDLLTKAKAAGMPVPGWAQALDTGLSKAEGLVGTLNYFNKTQEFFVRRGVFQANLAQSLRAEGKDLLQIIEQNQVGAIDPKHISKAVDTALRATFAEQPAYGTVGANFVKLMNQIPGATFVIPFPRFMVNSMKFLWEYNPTGLLKYLSEAERAAFAKGDTKTLTRATLGTGLLLSAWQVRNSEHAGERWYEIRGADGTTIDARPFNPFASYLFVADTIKRIQEGKLDKLTWRDMLTGVLSTNLRAGTGLYLVDEAIQGLSRSDTAEKLGRHAKEFAGEAAAGFLTPLQQINDLLAEFDDNYKVIRDTRAEPFTGPLKAKVPGMVTDLPPAVSATRSGDMKRPQPLMKQVTGLQVRSPKNAAEAELDRLGFTGLDIFKPTGEYDFDRRRKEAMGPMVEQFLVPVIESPGYQSLSDNEKGLMVSRALRTIHGQVNQMAESLSPLEEREARKAKKGGRWERKVRAERTAQ